MSAGTQGRAEDHTDKLGWNATFSMAVGGMIGGGIFSVLGVVVDIAGPWAWMSFVLGGALAFTTALSYVGLAASYGEGGGAFTFLRDAGHAALAGGLSWILLAGYVLTTAVYAFTLGHYTAHVFDAGPVVARIVAVTAMAAMTALNVRGVGESSTFEVLAVWGKLAVLGWLAVMAVGRWAPERLSEGVASGSVSGVVVGAAAVFMAYEGFQLLTYDYEDMRDPDRTLPRAVLPAVIVVMVVYVAVTLAATTLVGAGTIVEQREVALAAAGRAAAGTVGMVLVSAAAALSAGSAINATLFATARLARRVAADGELPGWLADGDDGGVPKRAVMALGLLGALLSAVGTLGGLVEAASLTFLVTFAGVNAMAAQRLRRRRVLAVVGAVGTAAAAVVASVRIASNQPLVFAAVGAAAVGALVVRPLWLSHRA